MEIVYSLLSPLSSTWWKLYESIPSLHRSFGQCSCISWEVKKINAGEEIRAFFFFPPCFSLKQWWFSLPHHSLRCCHSWTGGLALSLKNFIVKEKSGGSSMKNFNHPVCSPFEGGTIVPIVTTTEWEKGPVLPPPATDGELSLLRWLEILAQERFRPSQWKEKSLKWSLKCTSAN